MTALTGHVGMDCVSSNAYNCAVRILACNYEFPPLGSGGGNALRYLSREWTRRGHEVTVVTSNWEPRRLEETVGGARVVRVPVRRKRLDYSRLVELAAYVLAGRREVKHMARRREQYDVVVSFFVVPSGLVGDLAATIACVPHVVRIGGGDIPGHEKRLALVHRLVLPVTRALLARAAFRVANSEGLRARAERCFGMEFAVIENGVDLQQFSPSPDSPVRDAPVVLFVSRLIERKGLHFLLAALARMKDRVPRFQLVVAGDGPLRAQLEAQANSLGLGDRVRWLGNVPHDRLPDVYRSADIFVLPSLSEGMANVALEAAASGLPLVLTDVPGTAELLVHGRNGFVVAPADVESLANAIERLLLDPHLRRRMGQASREVVARWSWPVLADRYLALFEQAISEWRATK